MGARQPENLQNKHWVNATQIRFTAHSAQIQVNMKKFSDRKKSEAGFIVADFIFSFVMVIGIGIFIFALTFSLATVEISQYIVWSAARSYASAKTDELSAQAAAGEKFRNLSGQFPLLTGQGEANPWFKLDGFTAQDHKAEANFISKVTNVDDRLNRDGNKELRQPWTGASADIYFKLFGNLNIPLFGKISTDPKTMFTCRVYAVIIRSPSFQECSGFFKARFKDGIQPLENFSGLGVEIPDYMVEDNGC